MDRTYEDHSEALNMNGAVYAGRHTHNLEILKTKSVVETGSCAYCGKPLKLDKETYLAGILSLCPECLELYRREGWEDQ